MNKSEVIHLRLDSDTLEILRQQARANYRTIAQEINFTLRENTQQGKGK